MASRLTVADAEGVEHAYEFDHNRFLNTEFIAIRKATGLGFHDFINGFTRGMDSWDMDALTALIWILRRRAGEHDLKFGDVEFNVMSLGFEFDDGGVPADTDNQPGADPTSGPAEPANAKP